jgi:nicotinamidase-related amidase
MLRLDNTFMLLVDMQGKLARTVEDSEEITNNLIRLIKGIRILEVPIIWMEQYPKGLGPTAADIMCHLEGLTPFDKTSFGCGGDERIMDAIKGLNRKQAVVAGIETHVCVYQSCKQLLEAGYEVTLLDDCTSSRHKSDREVAVRAMRDAGVKVATVEMVLFELMHVAGGDKFKQISQLVK